MPLLTFLGTHVAVLAGWHLCEWDGEALLLSISTPVALFAASIGAAWLWHSSTADTPEEKLRFVGKALALASAVEPLRFHAFVKLSSDWQPLTMELSHLRLIDAASLIVAWHAAVGGFIVMLGLQLARPRSR